MTGPLALGLLMSAPLIHDPDGILKTVDLFVGHPAFESAFVCGAETVYEVNDCANQDGGYYCDPTVRVTQTVDDCKPDSVTLRGKSESFGDWVITRADFDAAGGNMLRAQLARMMPNADPRDSIDVDTLGRGFYSLANGNRIRSLTVGLILNFYVRAPNGHRGYERLPLEIGVSDQEPASAELLWMRVIHADEPAAYRLLSTGASR